MADFTALKTTIQTYIKQNGNEEITGNILQEVLLAMVQTMGDGAINDLVTDLSDEVTARQNADTTLGNSLQAIRNAIDNGYVYAGIATPTGTPVGGKVFYFAVTAGTYTNFGGLTVTQGINILKYNGSAWSVEQVVGIDDVPTAGSNNFVKSSGINKIFANCKFFITYGSSNVQTIINENEHYTQIVIPSGRAEVFDYQGGYRFIAAGTYTCNQNKILCLSYSDQSYQEVDLSIKGTGETVYLYPVGYTVATAGQLNTMVGMHYSRSWYSPFFSPTSDLMRDLRWNEPVEIAYTSGGFIITRNATVDIETPTASSVWSYAVIDCIEGNKFFINAQGQGVLASAWCFIDSSGNVLSQSSETLVREVITAPENSAKLVLNKYSTTPAGWTSYKFPSKIMEYDWVENVVTKKFKEYSKDWIDFTVQVNQYIQNLSDTRDIQLDATTNENVACILKLPREYNPNGKPVRLVMFCHGSGTTIDQYKVQTEYNRLVDAFTAAGYAVFDCAGYKDDEYGCGFWGAPRGISGYYHAYEYVINNYNVEHEFAIYGFSMGGLTALGLASRCAPNIKCIALGAPVVDLQDAWIPTSRHPYIAAAYGFADSNTYEVDKTVGCDPTLGIVTIGTDEYYFRTLPPIKVWHGLDDTVSPTASLRLVNAIKKANGMADYRAISGAGHEICYGGDTKIIPEFVLWINRF